MYEVDCFDSSTVQLLSQCKLRCMTSSGQHEGTVVDVNRVVCEGRSVWGRRGEPGHPQVGRV